MWVRATKGPKQESNRLRLFMPDAECIYVIRVYPSKGFRVGFALIVRYIIYNFIWWFASYLWNVGRFSPRTLDSSTKFCEILLTVALNSNNNPNCYLYCLYNKMTRLITPFRIYWRKRCSEYHHRIVHISNTMGGIIGAETAYHLLHTSSSWDICDLWVVQSLVYSIVFCGPLFVFYPSTYCFWITHWNLLFCHREFI
jgi:hypothetical protein